MKHASLGTAFARGDNNFNALRLLAACLVLLSHSYSLIHHMIDPVSRLTAYHIDGGGLGVAIFFSISGFLVTRSVLYRDTTEYLTARLLRIMPALIVVTLFQTLIIGSLFTDLPLSDYLSNPNTLLGLRNALVFKLEVGLPGVFLKNTIAGWINGSMWTLPVECSFYVFLPLLALIGVFRPKRIVLATTIVFLVLYFLMGWLGFSWDERGPYILGSVELFPALDCLAYFMMGATLWVHRDDVPLSGGLTACCLIAMFAATGTISSRFIDHLCIPYLTMFAALARPGTEKYLHRIGDLSYGIYLYAFPIQQALIALIGPELRPSHLAFLSAPIALTCGAASFHLIERPALKLKVNLISR